MESLAGSESTKGLIAETAALKDKAEDLRSFMEAFLVEVQIKSEGGEKPNIKTLPFQTMRDNLSSTSRALDRIRELFTTKVINELK